MLHLLANLSLKLEDMSRKMISIPNIATDLNVITVKNFNRMVVRMAYKSCIKSE